MKKIIQILIFLILPVQLYGQNHFYIKKPEAKVEIPFKLIGNLIIVKVNVNDSDLNLIFDTGVKQTILLNLAKKDSLYFKKIKKRLFVGVGNEKHRIEAIKTIDNKINLNNKISSTDAEVYLITNAEFTFSEKMGIPVFGFIGGDLIKNFILKIDYRKKKLVFYSPDNFNTALWKRYIKIPVDIYKDKPYIKADIQFSKKTPKKTLNLLIDTGNSDPVWIFQNDSLKVPSQQSRIKDYFGLGLNGDITGERIKAYRFIISPKIHFKRVITGLPDSVYYKNLIKNHPFDGIIGGEVLKRFKIYFDYKNKSIYLKKRWLDFYRKFPFNESGLYLAYEGKIPLKIKRILTTIDTRELSSGGNNIIIDNSDFVYEYKFFDKIVVHYIRPDSPADKAGFAVGDVILEINGESVYQYKLNKLEDKFLYKSRKKLSFIIERNGVFLKLKLNTLEQL